MERVLVVDDDPRIRELLAEYLASRGLEVETAPDGTQALARLRAGGLDLVVLDVMMADRVLGNVAPVLTAGSTGLVRGRFQFQSSALQAARTKARIQIDACLIVR